MKSLMRSICLAAGECTGPGQKVAQARFTLQPRNGDVVGVNHRRVHL